MLESSTGVEPLADHSGAFTEQAPRRQVLDPLSSTRIG